MNKLPVALGLAAMALVIGTQAGFAQTRPSGPSTYSYPSADEQCGAEMGYLRFIRKDVVQDIAPSRVAILPVCENVSLFDRFDSSRLFQEGNVSGLRGTIGQNGYLAEALYDKNYDADDVVGMRVNNEDLVILYVHKH